MESTRWACEQCALALLCPSKQGRKKKNTDMNLNQLTIIGFIGKQAETKYLPNGTPVVKFSVATKKSWKDDNDVWRDKTQWHPVVAFGKKFEQMTPRLVKGAHVFVQGELSTREYERTIQVPNGKKTIEHVIQQLAVELKADTIRLLDRSSANAEPSDAAEPPQEVA
jgi:single-strand DNA-binding protein